MARHVKTISSNKIVAFLICAVLLQGIVGCGGGSSSGDSPAPTPIPPAMPAPPPEPMGNATNGLAVFERAESSGNQFSCANCHAIAEDAQGFSTSDNLRRPAHPIFNAINRASFHNGMTSTLFDAVNICRQDWMQVETFSESDDDWLDLEAFFQEQSDESVAMEVSVTQVMPITDFTAGNQQMGQTLFNQTCATCHGENALGSELAGDLTLRRLDKDGVAQKVRTSGPSDSQVFVGLQGGNMPFWSQERLSDEDLAHIAEYVDSISLDDNAPMGCNGSDHPKVGQMATLQTFAHDVSGQAEVIDNCTIHVRNFTYDGGGPNVIFYGAENGEYENGFPLGSRLDGRVFSGETLVLTFDNPALLNSIDGLSVWCVEFGANFGDGLFE